MLNRTMTRLERVGASENFPEKFWAKTDTMYIARAKVFRKLAGVE